MPRTDKKFVASPKMIENKARLWATSAMINTIFKARGEPKLSFS
jgi:hypothetical protein